MTNIKDRCKTRGMKTCPHCHQESKDIKAGRHASGSQRYQCEHCRRRYTPEPSPHGYSDEYRHQAVKLYLEGNSYRQIGRLLQVSYMSVVNWVHDAAAQLKAAPLPTEVAIIEEDELFSFVGDKKSPFT